MDDYIERQAREIDPLYGAQEAVDMAQNYSSGTGDSLSAAQAEALTALIGEVRRLRALVEPEAEAERQRLLGMLWAEQRSVESDYISDDMSDEAATSNGTSSHTGGVKTAPSTDGASPGATSWGDDIPF